MRKNTPDDFWRFVDKSGECWLWTGARRSPRYGKFNLAGVVWFAHRFSWHMSTGRQIPDGMEVCHTCDNGFCVRPEHLFLGTHLENMQDRSRKGRVNPARGSNNPISKLTEMEVVAIRAEYAAGALQVNLAAKYSVIQTTISKIIRRQQWTHV